MDKLLKMRRRFSTEFVREKVSLIEEGKVTIAEICKTYEVTRTAVYKWLYKHGTKYQKQERIVVEKISEEKKTLELMQKVAELERVVGQQQLQIIYKDSVIKCASKAYGEDVEKKFNCQQSR